MNKPSNVMPPPEYYENLVYAEMNQYPKYAQSRALFLWILRDIAERVVEDFIKVIPPENHTGLRKEREAMQKIFEMIAQEESKLRIGNA